MSDYFEATIDCCETLTDTATDFIAALEKTSGMTRGGMMKNKRCARIINNRIKRNGGKE